MKMLFSFRGRIGRAEYWLVFLAAYLAFFAIVVGGGVVAGVGGDEALSPAGMVSVGLDFVALFALALIQVCIGVKRFHDRGKPGVWTLVTLVPMVGWLWYLIEVGFLPGAPGDNAYGPDPRGEQTIAKLAMRNA